MFHLDWNGIYHPDGKWSCVFQTQRNKDRTNWASINSTALVHWEYQVGLWTFQVLKKICSVKVTFDSGHNVENFCLLALGEGGWCLYLHWRICGCVFDYKRRRLWDDTQTYIQYCMADLYELLEWRRMITSQALRQGGKSASWVWRQCPFCMTWPTSGGGMM